MSLSEGLLVLRETELGELGTPPDQSVAELRRIREQSGFLFTVDMFDRLLALGRVGRGQALLGTLLDIKPILTLDDSGAVAPLDRVRGRKNLLPRVMNLLEKQIPADARSVRFGVVHVACEDTAEKVATALRARYGNPDVIIAPVSPILATHAGPGAWGVAYQVED